MFARYSRTTKSLRRLFLDEFADDVLRLGTAEAPRMVRARPRGSTSECSSSTATTRWRSSAACTSRASSPRSCWRRRSSGGGSPPTSSSRRGTCATTTSPAVGGARPCRPSSSTRRSPIPTPGSWTTCSRRTASCTSASSRGSRSGSRSSPTTPTSSTARRCWPRRATPCGCCCRPARARTSGSTRRGQSYEQLLMRLAQHPLAEMRDYGELMLVELRKVIPEFLKRVDQPERGIAWSASLARRARADRRARRQAGRRRRPRAARIGQLS